MGDHLEEIRQTILRRRNFYDKAVRTMTLKDAMDYIHRRYKIGTSADETCIFEDSHIAICTADRLGMKTVGIYDKYNYGQKEIRKTTTVYIAEGDSFKSLIP